MCLLFWLDHHESPAVPAETNRATVARISRLPQGECLTISAGGGARGKRMIASRMLQFAVCSIPCGMLLQSLMAVRIVVVLALLFAFAYGFAKLVEHYGGVGDQPSPCEELSDLDCPDPNAPPAIRHLLPTYISLLSMMPPSPSGN